MTIPASDIVAVNSNVLSAGGQALDLIGLILSNNTRFPIGQAVPFSDKDDVISYCGASSVEGIGAPIYFSGFDGSSVKPASILFWQYNTTAVAAYLRGGSLQSMTLTQLKALTGVLTLTVNGIATTSATINLSSATSFTNAATIMLAAFASPSFTISFDSVSNAFIFLVNTTGVTSTITFATGTLSTPLLLATGTGGVISQGAAATDPVSTMNAIIKVTTNWATFMTAFDPDSSGFANKLIFAQWEAQQNNRYLYVCSDTDQTPGLQVPATSSLGFALESGNVGGVALIDEPLQFMTDWFLCGAIASINFNATNGNTDLAFKSQTGLFPAVTDRSFANNLLANGYNFYGAYATGNDNFIWFYKGTVTGRFNYIRAYVNQIWLTNQIQLALMVYFDNVLASPYNVAGYTAIESACLDPINQAVNFGAIQKGITLSQAQIAEINAAAGGDVATTVQNTGWYLQVLDASPQVRAAGGSPPINLWYCDGGSIQSLVLNAIDVQ